MNNTRHRLAFLLTVLILVLYGQVKVVGQISIVNAHLNTFNVTPGSICEVSVMNLQAAAQVIMEAKVLNSSNEPILIVTTSTFTLNAGMNILSSMNIPISSTEYGTSAQATYVQTTHNLPSGKFIYCCTIQVLTTEGGDEYCEEVESEINSYMYLVYPDDKEIIEITTPVLMWTHSEPFNMVASGEYYRMIVVELDADQNAESGITVNNPIFMKNSLNTHNVQYPIDAQELEIGKRYGWQVQRVTNGVITNKTEAWEFTLKPAVITKVHKYAVLRKSLDASFYTAENGKLYFRYDEEYKSGNISCMIYNSAREKILPIAKNEYKSNNQIGFKNNGYNCYEIDLNDLNNIKTGFYTLEVKNGKNELYLLKFYVQ